MEIKYFALGTEEKNKLVNVLRIVFGIFCISIAIFWISFNIKSLKADSTLWITIIFLTGFGLYQIWAGLGRATRFIETGPEFIRLKKNPIFPAIVLKKDDIEKIELFPLNLIFFMKRKKESYFVSVQHIMIQMKR